MAFRERGWEERRFALLALTIFGPLFHKRALSTPEFSYLLQVTLPATTLCLILIERLSLGIKGYLSHNKIGRLPLSFLFISILLFGIYTTREKLPVYSLLQMYQLDNPEFWSGRHEGSVFYERVGHFVFPEAMSEYERIAKYIEEHTEMEEPIHIYPPPEDRIIILREDSAQQKWRSFFVT